MYTVGIIGGLTRTGGGGGGDGKNWLGKALGTRRTFSDCSPVPGLLPGMNRVRGYMYATEKIFDI